MQTRLRFDEVFKIDSYGLEIFFTDGTYARYTVDELANLRPRREPSKKLESTPVSLQPQQNV